MSSMAQSGGNRTKFLSFALKVKGFHLAVGAEDPPQSRTTLPISVPNHWCQYSYGLIILLLQRHIPIYYMKELVLCFPPLKP